MSDRKCTACGYGGALVRLACPACDKLDWYCSDCRVGARAYNCGECQAPPEALPLVPCPMCGAGMCGEPEELKARGLLMICDGCHIKFDKKAVPGYPGIYAHYEAYVCMCANDCGSLRN